MIDISPQERLAAQRMLKQLQDERLEVTLIPAPDPRHSGHMIRVVENQNPRWYRDLCAAFPRHRRNRKPKYTDSIIVRSNVIKALRNISMGKNGTVYCERILPYVGRFTKSND